MALLKALDQYNLINGEYYKLDYKFTDDGRLLRLTIKIKNNKSGIKISIFDSYRLLTGSL